MLSAAFEFHGLQAHNSGMNINPYNTALSGIRNGMAEMDRNAVTIATASRNGDQTDSVEEALVRIKESERTVEANVKVAKTADEMLGTLLDELA